MNIFNKKEPLPTELVTYKTVVSGEVSYSEENGVIYIDDDSGGFQRLSLERARKIHNGLGLVFKEIDGLKETI